jgi:hypothetical protein
MRGRSLAITLIAACGGGSTALPSNKVAPDPSPTAKCVEWEATITEAQLADNALVMCLRVPRPKGDVADCWRVNVDSSTWGFVYSKPYVEPAPRAPEVTVTATQARACNPGGDCKEIPLSGITVAPDDTVSGTTNADRSIVAVWTGPSPIHVFDAKGKHLAAIQPWPTAMSGDVDPAFFREAHVLGSIVEVRISDTPVTSAIRLYDARGQKIADVFDGKPMNDSLAPVALGGSRYLFQSFDDPRMVVVVDVVTGRQIGVYSMPGTQCPRS